LNKSISSGRLTPFWVRIATLLAAVTTGFILLAMAVPLLLPDSQILMESDLSGNWDIYRMDMSRNMVINLTHNLANDHDASWSARTQQIAFSSDRDGDNGTEIYVMGGGGDHVRRITPPDGIYWKPAWLPDGQHLSVVFNFGNIQMLDLTTNENRFFAYGFAPAWSSDGHFVAYNADHPRTDSNVDIYTEQADGSNLRDLTQNPANDWGQAWSPDGKSIAFVSTRDGNAEIYITTALCDTSAPCTNTVMRLTHNPAIDQSPSWSPDGQQIAFESNRDGSRQIYVVDVNGNDLQQITRGKANHAVPVWIK
jgi:Tol biopolymer transport system component